MPPRLWSLVAAALGEVGGEILSPPWGVGGAGEPLTRAQPWPFPQLSPAVPQVQVYAGQTRKASSSFW